MAEVNDLAAELADARNEEAQAREKRIAIEQRIVEATGIGDSERKTIKTEVGLKLVVQTGYNYRLAKDFDRSVVPHKETVKVELDTKAYEALPDEARKAASKYVTVTPKKPSVSVQVA